MNQGNKDVLAKNLKKYIQMTGKDRKEVAIALGVPYSTMTDWVNGNKYPRINNIEMMAEYFGVTKSDLIEDFEQKQKDNDTLSNIIVQLRTNRDLLDIVETLSSLDRAKLVSLKNLLDTLL